MNSGQEFNIKVTATDQNGNTFTSYTGSIFLTSTNTNAIIPEPGNQKTPYKFESSENGVHNFGLKLISDKNETYSITISDGTKIVTSKPITVIPKPTLNHFEFNPIPNKQTVGFDINIQVKAIDQFGDTLTSYVGTPTLTYSKGTVNPNTVTIWSNGLGTATVRVKDSGTNGTLTINDGAAYGTSNPFDVTTASSSSFIVDAKALIKVGETFPVSVIALDEFGEVDLNYLGTVHFSSNDGSAILPSDYTFTKNDMGVHSFPTTLNTATNTTIIVTEIANPSHGGFLVRDVHKHIPSIVSFGGSSIEYAEVQTLNPSYPWQLQAGDLIILQIVGVSCSPYPPAGFQLLYGPDTSGMVQQWLYYRFATGSEITDPSGIEYVKFACPGEAKTAVMFSFRGVSSIDFIDGGALSTGNGSLITAPPVTTTGNSRLAVTFTFMGASYWDPVVFNFNGSKGGSWVFPFVGPWISQYWSTSGYPPIVVITDVEVADLEYTGTISDGSMLLNYPCYWGVRAFSLVP